MFGVEFLQINLILLLLEFVTVVQMQIVRKFIYYSKQLRQLVVVLIINRY